MKRTLSLLLLLTIALAGVGLLYANGASEGDGIIITLSPATLILSSKVDALTLHSNIPLSIVDCDSLTLDGLLPYLVKADARGCLVAKFRIEDVKQIVQPGTATLTLSGLLIEDGSPVPFEASDTITVKE